MGKARGRGSERSRSFLLFLSKTLYRFRSFSLPFRLVWEGACSFLSFLSSQKGWYLSLSLEKRSMSLCFFLFLWEISISLFLSPRWIQKTEAAKTKKSACIGRRNK